MSYTWDDRGNLTHDGTFTAHTVGTYNAAGRLVGAQSVTYSLVYTYNGDGVRVGMYDSWDVYTFTQDLAAGLPSVLVETTGGSSVLYLYGAGRLAEKQDGNGEWYLGDALGSVRQMADDDGDVVLLQVYSPFGQLLSESETGETGYGFTGEEYAGYTQLVYLRARWYSSLTLTKSTTGEVRNRLWEYSDSLYASPASLDAMSRSSSDNQ